MEVVEEPSEPLTAFYQGRSSLDAILDSLYGMREHMIECSSFKVSPSGAGAGLT